MAKKKKEESIHDVLLCLSPQQLDKLLRYDAELRAVLHEIDYRKLNREIYLAQIDPKRTLAKLDAQIQNLTAKYQAAAETYKKVQGELSQQLGVDLSKHSIDENTGAVHELPQSPEPVVTQS